MQLSSANYTALKIVSVKQEVKGVKTFVLEKTDGTALKYKDGQFLTFVLDHHKKEERRSFSISSGSALREPLAITVKRVDNGVYSRFLSDKARVGDILYTTGAAGLFTIPPDIEQYKQLFFFAAGIGITPIFSIIKTVLYTTTIPVVLIYSNRNKEETVFYEELLALMQQFSQTFKVVFLFSNSFDLSRARLNKELLPKLVDEYAITEKENMLFYICGPHSYMRMAIFALEEYGAKQEQIKKENFNTEVKPLTKSVLPDTAPHQVTIHYNMETYQFQVQYPDTILAAAKKLKIPLPYSCETGRCGSCAAVCKTGKVWMSYNEVLMDNDIAKGMILTCVGYPLGSDVDIYL